MLKSIIDQYIKDHNIIKYHLEEKVWPASEWSNSLLLGRDIVFIYNMNLICAIDNSNDFSNGLFSLVSPNNKVQYKEIITVTDINGAIQLSSNIISVHHSAVKHVTDSATIYSKIYSGHYKYIIFKNLD